MRGPKGDRGFTLIELLIAITIILIIAAFSIVKITNALIAAHEASAISSIRTINQAELIYASSHADGSFTSDLLTLDGTAQSGGEQSIDEDLARGRKSGYTFTYIAGDRVNGTVRTYTITAEPELSRVTGRRRFYSDESGVIRADGSGPADASSPPL